MTQPDYTEIPLSKRKILLTLFGAILFVGAGIWLLINPPEISNPVLGNSTVVFVAGWASILFFGLVVVLISRKLTDRRAGLVISREGITDNSGGVPAGFVSWTDIEEIKVSQTMNQKFLVLVVKNPQDYIDKVRNPIRKKSMEMNNKSHGSPICISANSLQTNSDSLFSLLTNKMKEYKPQAKREQPAKAGNSLAGHTEY